MKWQLGSAIAFVLGISATAASALPPEFTHYEPHAFLQRTLDSLPAWGAFALPDGLDASVTAGLAPDRVNLATPEALIGQLDRTLDTLHGDSSFTIYDISGTILFRVHETIKPCPDAAIPGRCNRVDIDTALDSVEGKPAPFSVVFADRGLEYQRYGVPVNVSAWRYELDDAWEWLHHALLETSGRVAFEHLSWHDQILLSLAADPSIAPCVPGLTVYAQGGRIIVSGVVP
jgi:hypothetical protein